MGRGTITPVRTRLKPWKLRGSIFKTISLRRRSNYVKGRLLPTQAQSLSASSNPLPEPSFMGVTGERSFPATG
jgi:hypothetical protein